MRSAKRSIFTVACLLILAAVAGCRINVYRLNKRLDRWESIKDKASVKDKVRFARESLIFFLSTPDLQRGRESLVTEAERLHYHERMCAMQIFLIDYHAGRALSYLAEGNEDWEKARIEWYKADSLTYGLIPGTGIQKKMVLLQRGYKKFIKEISADGTRYNRMEQRFPGLMEAFRKMSDYQFKVAEHLYNQGLKKEALQHYLLVFKRDPKNFGNALAKVYRITGRTIREIYDIEDKRKRILDTYDYMREDVYRTIENSLQAELEGQSEYTEDQLLGLLLEDTADYHGISIEQAADLYFYRKNELEGTLPQYINLERYLVLQGQKSIRARLLKTFPALY